MSETTTQWEVVDERGVRSHFCPAPFASEQDALEARNSREVFPELWLVRPIEFLAFARSFYRF